MYLPKPGDHKGRPYATYPDPILSANAVPHYAQSDIPANVAARLEPLEPAHASTRSLPPDFEQSGRRLPARYSRAAVLHLGGGTGMTTCARWEGTAG